MNDNDSHFARRWFYSALVITLAIKIILAASIPITSDEAYFVGWGQHFALGYYDHLPMIGWFFYLLSRLGQNAVGLPLPVVLWSTLLGGGIYRLWQANDDASGGPAATVVPQSPGRVGDVL